MDHPIIEIRGLCKSYGQVHALKNVSVGFEKGKVHALLGENGAGKSTMIKILSGVEPASSGDILMDGSIVNISTPSAAHELGISTVYQEPVQVMSLSVSENIFAGRLPKTKLGLLDAKQLKKDTQELMEQINIHLDPDAKLESLSIAQRQLVEILKAVSQNARFVIFDEPTSSLTKDETDTLYQIINDLCRKGITILYISHRLEEIFALCETVTILRDGEFVCQKPINEMNQDSIIHNMVGRNIENLYVKKDISIGEEVLRVEHLRSAWVKDASFALHRGEILGFGGLVGAGRTEVARALFGIDPHNGEIRINGKKAQITSPWKAIKEGIALVPEDRKTEGFVNTLNIRENISVINMYENSRMGFLNQHKEKEQIQKLIQLLQIKTPSDQQLVSNLSGGNQQKVVFAKWLTREINVLILDEPTRGIDVGAKAEIYSIIEDLAQSGVGIIMISSEMPELLAMSDRILVMCNGKVSGTINRPDFSEDLLMRLALEGIEE